MCAALDQGRDYVRSQAKAAGRSAMPDVFSPSNPPQRRTDHDTHTHGHGYTPFVRQAPSAFSSVSSSSSSHAPGDPQEASFGKAVVKLPPWMSKFSGGGRPTRTHATQPSSSSSPLASQQSTRRGGGPLSSSTSSSTRAQDYNYRSFLSSGKKYVVCSVCVIGDCYLTYRLLILSIILLCGSQLQQEAQEEEEEEEGGARGRQSR
jgi:hypothetical protein